MGSGQSLPAEIKKTAPIETPSESSSSSTNDHSSNKKVRRKSPPHLKGFALIEYKCRQKKRAYDVCSSTNHKAFVAGLKVIDIDGDEISCDDLFDTYKECIYKGMLKHRQKRGLKEAGGQSALGDYAEYADED
mmetsp:Transcript_9849/g.14801  ORF Transcript_9849/g.14801 Transcript_9849/m.14801 type:complete len:133 (+) Transcript_9849:125-523(+)|eukprot:CAMPEP_0194116738 /NCGR_PEP_ID=MMETSP0150-20130528/28439_1 /TAXON_ID=122233 /ORGANISM="Chaetoceros debilis, Strain MM31A-1" /LENGTH=132 /DNA_ID=CAMNT_0038807531 /DNA_START=55 /DNA_END=453 /DNA_ORIENTATION=-